jgi:hypothetical protein
VSWDTTCRGARGMRGWARVRVRVRMGGCGCGCGCGCSVLCYIWYESIQWYAIPGTLYWVQDYGNRFSGTLYLVRYIGCRITGIDSVVRYTWHAILGAGLRESIQWYAIPGTLYWVQDYGRVMADRRVPLRDRVALACRWLFDH